MSLPEKELRQAFRRHPRVVARVTPHGFAFFDQEVPHFEGRIAKAHVVRKLFWDSVLACFSQDGVRARDGTLCDDCRHPRCQPQMRIHLHERHAVFLVDLAYSSARNLIALLDELDGEGLAVDDVTLRLSVLDHGRWGEVVFARLDTPAAESAAESGDRPPVVTPKPPDDPDDVAPEQRGC